MKLFFLILLFVAYSCSSKKSTSDISCENISMTDYNLKQGLVKLRLPSEWKTEDSSIFMKDLITLDARVVRTEDTSNLAFYSLTRILDLNKTPKSFSDLDFALNVLAKDNSKSPDSILRIEHNTEKGWKIATRKSIILSSSQSQNIIGQILAVNDSLKLQVYFKASGKPIEELNQLSDCIFKLIKWQ